MIIVSQDKKVITNFDNTLGIQIEETIINADGEKDYGIKTITEKRTCGIGIYATEERAKEVLQEIAKTYVLTEQYKVEDERTRIKLMMEGILLYEMPKE